MGRGEGQEDSNEAFEREQQQVSEAFSFIFVVPNFKIDVYSHDSSELALCVYMKESTYEGLEMILITFPLVVSLF